MIKLLQLTHLWSVLCLLFTSAYILCVDLYQPRVPCQASYYDYKHKRYFRIPSYIIRTILVNSTTPAWAYSSVLLIQVSWCSNWPKIGDGRRWVSCGTTEYKLPLYVFCALCDRVLCSHRSGPESDRCSHSRHKCGTGLHVIVWSPNHTQLQGQM